MAADAMLPERGDKRASGLLGALTVLAACAVVYWAWLGSSGFGGTEGHRVIPGWTMLETRDWLHVTMFEQTYLRKPPGMAWAIGASAAVLGESEFSARAVSAGAATASALVAFLFAGRWFGRRWGVYAGLCQALTPLFWQPGRTADIEALHNLGVQLVVLALIDTLAPARWRRGELRWRLDMALVAACGFVLAVVMKGPAGAPAVGGLMLGLLIVCRRGFNAVLPVLTAAVVLAAAALGPVAMVVLRANAGAGAVKEDVSGFMWSWSTLFQTAQLPVAAFIAALPAAVWALFPLGRDARREAERGGPGAQNELRIARVLAWSWMASLGACVLAGLSNPRYAMPGAVMLAPLAAYVAKGAVSGAFMPKRRLIARIACLGHPLVLGVLLGGVAVFMAAREANWDPDRRGGPDAGAAIAAMLPAPSDPIELWADGLVEARPDVLLYASRLAHRNRVELRPLWRKASVKRGELPPVGALLALRTDARGDERPAYAGAITDGSLTPLGGASVHKFEFTVYAVTARR